MTGQVLSGDLWQQSWCNLSYLMSQGARTDMSSGKRHPWSPLPDLCAKRTQMLRRIVQLLWVRLRLLSFRDLQPGKTDPIFNEDLFWHKEKLETQ